MVYLLMFGARVLIPHVCSAFCTVSVPTLYSKRSIQAVVLNNVDYVDKRRQR